MVNPVVPQSHSCTAFEGSRRIASGAIADVAVQAKAVMDRGPKKPVLIFDNITSELVEVDFRGTANDVRQRLEPPAAEPAPPPSPGPGRPKLGVVAREVTLLPRHWDWLAAQRGGASVALRKLVEAARKAREPADRRRAALESAYRFLSTMAGDEAGFEEATRALFAGKRKRFEEMSEPWPRDVREHARKLAAAAFDSPP